MKNFFIGMFCNYNNVVSQTKFWNNVGIGVVIGMFIYLGIYKEIPEWLGWIYLFMVTPTKLFNKIITLKWGYAPPNTDNKEGKDE